METAIKRLKNPNFTPAIGSDTTFAKRQPTGLQKSLGHHKKRTLRDLLNVTLQGKHKDITEARRLIAELIGCSVQEAKQFTFEEWINITQIKRAANKSDAWNSLMNRVYGSPTQTINQAIHIEVTVKPRAQQLTNIKPIEIIDYTLIEPSYEAGNVK